MLIYVNQFNLIGDDSTTKAFRTIAGWLKEKTQKAITIEQLKSGDEFFIDKYKIRTYAATQYEPLMYSVMLSHPDDIVKGRQWVTEIGVIDYPTYTKISILLETSDISTQVISIPLTTRPKLVKYLHENTILDQDTVGKTVRQYNNTSDSFRSLSVEIDRPERTYPIVIISNDDKNKPVINPQKLQDQLFGLAQVISTQDEIDSWEMERHLSKRLSAWGGAINIVYPPNGRGYCYNKLLLNTVLNEWSADNKNINSEILSIITHTTNGFRKKKHFSPTDVRAKRQKDLRKSLKMKFDELQDEQGFKSLAEEAFSQLEEHEAVIEELKKEHEKQLLEQLLENEEIADKNNSLLSSNTQMKYQIESLKHSLESSSDKTTSQNLALSPREIIDSICGIITPETCLKIISQLYPSRVIVLDDAIVSSRDSINFKNPTKLLEYLSRLVTEYLDIVIDSGDNQARHVFGAAYSANESETVEHTPKLSSQRTFKYKGDPIAMFRHLKFGTSRNPDETLRVHFHIDSEQKIIVIGYCGPHLDVVST
ncbi:hypothetical protein [Aeromonas media]|uniref:hypothetical protein n=1 Tax=Aeromonas media TaxID=651 RepID=UPI00384F8EB6